jgi:CBS domain-containing protein
MKVDRVFTRQVLATTRSATLPEAAAAMSRYKVGALLVMEDEDEGRGPVGIVTDRDLALHGFATGAASS